MSTYIPLARKWRPAQLSDIVGQAPIVQTLNNAILYGRIHHAYVFAGSRGIGKTSVARIFAKAIRCESTFQKNNLLFSCDECSSCKEIAASKNGGVIEMDGASNNGVEAIREIRENVKYLPTSGLRKIYIIDEVHMLTTAAFNALLKTLEEPPPHILFIFATTEPHKIPATILSRCQRFDYRRISFLEIQNRLTHILQTEKISANSAALDLIARAADGSMRDALSLLDQVIAFSQEPISIQTVRECIGLLPRETLFEILQSVFERNPLKALKPIQEAYDSGHDLCILARTLLEFLHACLLVKINTYDYSLLNFSIEEWKNITSISQLRDLEEIELIFQVLHLGIEWMAKSPQPKIILDVLLIKCAIAESLVAVDFKTQTPQTSMDPPPISKAEELSWEGLIAHTRKSRPLLASILERSNTTTLPTSKTEPHERILILTFSPEEAYFREQLQSRLYQEELLNLSKEYLKFPIQLKIASKSNGESIASRKEKENQERTLSIQKIAENHPILIETQSLFGGGFGPIEIKEKQENVKS